MLGVKNARVTLSNIEVEHTNKLCLTPHLPCSSAQLSSLSPSLSPSLHTALHKSPELIPRTRTGFNSKITTGTSSLLGGHPPTEGLRGAHSCARSTNSPVCLPTCSGNIVRAPFACSAHPRALLVTSSLVASQCQCLSQKLAVPLSTPQLCNSFTCFPKSRR